MGTRLYVAVGKSSKQKFEDLFDERTAGAWRSHVQVIPLYEKKEDRLSNDGWIEHYAKLDDTESVLAAAHLTSTKVNSTPKVKRLVRNALNQEIESWFQENDLDWRDNLGSIKNPRSTSGDKRLPYKWCDTKTWMDQFEKFDPTRGRRVAMALLQQLKVISLSERANWFDCHPPADHNVYFLGSDQHSGDFGLINIFSHIFGQNLIEAFHLPEGLSDSRLRIFCDASWSGGESDRRIRCIYQNCEKKTSHISPKTKLSLRFAYLTDLAEERLKNTLESLSQCGDASDGTSISCPAENKMITRGEFGKHQGLAFQNSDIMSYVDQSDPQTMINICNEIGNQLAGDRPLGTKDIASTIAFAHSLPKAMLPVFTIDGKEVCNNNGEKFIWKALMRSEHVTSPSPDIEDYYCSTCPLAS
tara:strand:- start:420 stop:1664 length:1245 start_codon:yes stop_codon:yes gene_type:complete